MILLSGSSCIAQLCGQWTVSISVVDTKGKPILNAFVDYIDLPKDDPAARHAFDLRSGSPNTLVSTFIEGERTSVIYKLLIRAAGYKDLHTVTKVSYCQRTAETKVLLPASEPGTAPAPGTSSFCIYFVNEKDARIPGAVITLIPDVRLSSGKQYRLVADDNGRVEAKVLDGLYTIEVNADGYKALTLKEQLFPDDAQECGGYQLISSTNPLTY